MEKKIIIAPIIERQSLFWKQQNMPLVMLRSFLINCQSAGYEFRNRNEILKFLQDWQQIAPTVANRQTRGQIEFHVKNYRTNFDGFAESLQRVEFRAASKNNALPVIEFKINEQLKTS